MTELTIQFSTSTAFASGIIRRLTHSPFSHVDLVLAEGLLGVSGKDDSIHDPGGVLVRPYGMWPYLFPPRVAKLHCTTEVAEAVVAKGRSQIGKPFDNSALWGFLDDLGHRIVHAEGSAPPRAWHDTSSWFCSEFIAYSLTEGGFFPYDLVVMKNRVSPADLLLALNPYMDEDNIKEFLSLVPEQGL